MSQQSWLRRSNQERHITCATLVLNYALVKVEVSSLRIVIFWRQEGLEADLETSFDLENRIVIIAYCVDVLCEGVKTVRNEEFHNESLEPGLRQVY